jgi:hypothetical protein
MKINATSIALTHTLNEVDRKIAEIEDRQTRADTMDAAMTDAYLLQEYQAARQILAKGIGTLGPNVSFLGFSK